MAQLSHFVLGGDCFVAALLAMTALSVIASAEGAWRSPPLRQSPCLKFTRKIAPAWI